MVSPSLIAQQLSTLSLLSSFFPLEGELTLDPITGQSLPLLQTLACSSSPIPSSPALPTELSVILALPLSDAFTPLNLRLSFPLPSSTTFSNSIPGFTLAQPQWLSRASHAGLSVELTRFCSSWRQGQNHGSEDESPLEMIIEVVEWVKDRALIFKIREEEELKELLVKAHVNRVKDIGDFVRVWFWFPSLSTKSKRDDMVNWASQYGLTGFVLAGKPALLCVEGDVREIEAYMGEVKSVSWADVPSFQKKVSERLRTGITRRVFEDMVEITSIIDKNGQRGNRGDMGQVREWVDGQGLGAEFREVVGGGNFAAP